MSAVAAAVTMLGVPSSVMPTIATSTPGNSWIAKGGKIVSPVDLVGDVRREELEVGTLEAVAAEAAFDRMAATDLHPSQLGRAFVELVVADAVVVETHEVHGLDRRLVMEDR